MKKTIILYLVACCAGFSHLSARPPLTVICVIDQFAASTWNKVQPFLTGGIKKLSHSGRVYTQASYPHARPATATGHTALNTGAYAQDHGIVSNYWQDKTQRVVDCDDDDNIDHVIIGKDRSEPSKSAHNIMTTGISKRAHDAGCTVISLSHKSRSAICMAGHGGTPFWFDEDLGRYTSSTAFIPSGILPPWVDATNGVIEKKIARGKSLEWKLCYPDRPDAYRFTYIDDYRFAGPPRIAQTTISLPSSLSKRSSKYIRTPESVRDLLGLASTAIHSHRKKNGDKPLVIWISLSSLDLVGHLYGPDSKETVDMIYHIDKALDSFVTRTEQAVGKNKCTWVLTSDHGIMSMPELLKERGIHKAERIDATALMEKLNKVIYRRCNVKNLITYFDVPYYYFHSDRWNFLQEKVKARVIATCKSELQKLAGIKHVWSAEELKEKDFESQYGPESRESWFQKQYYADRCGEISCMVNPYCYMTTYKKGTSHCTPYDYDVSVPLVIKSPGIIRAGAYNDPVSMRHVSTTLSRILDVARPPHAPVLPLK